MVSSPASKAILGMTCCSSLFLGWLFHPTDMAASAPGRHETARGTVFHDRNHNGIRDAGEEGLAGVGVSDGERIVETDASGEYVLHLDAGSEVFVLKPAGWMTPLNENGLPQFYYLHRPTGSRRSEYPGVHPTGHLPEIINFPLFRQDEPEHFRALFFGDPQPRNQREVDYIAHDVVEDLIGFEGAFGVTLGDIVFDDLSLFESLNRVIGRIGLPWYNVVGNHDVNRDAPTDAVANETFARVYGPATYSFDWGPAHFLVLDNVFWKQKKDGPSYDGFFTERVLEYARNDLKRVTKNKLVVVCMHIPLNNVRNASALLHLLQEFPHTVSIAAHTHTMSHRFLRGEKWGWERDQAHHHIVNVTVSGSWWSGALDEEGIPHATMTDGTPNGYSIFHFEGNQYRVEFRAARRSADFQMAVYAPEAVARRDLVETLVRVNVFGGSEKSRTEIRLRPKDPWTPMKRVKQHDPNYVATRTRERRLQPKPGRDLPKPSNCDHLWQAQLPADLAAGTYLIEVRSEDQFGVVRTDERFLRVVP